MWEPSGRGGTSYQASDLTAMARRYYYYNSQLGECVRCYNDEIMCAPLSYTLSIPPGLGRYGSSLRNPSWTFHLGQSAGGPPG
jgi:hypothetical protein